VYTHQLGELQKQRLKLERAYGKSAPETKKNVHKINAYLRQIDLFEEQKFAQLDPDAPIGRCLADDGYYFRNATLARAKKPGEWWAQVTQRVFQALQFPLSAGEYGILHSVLSMSGGMEALLSVPAQSVFALTTGAVRDHKDSTSRKKLASAKLAGKKDAAFFKKLEETWVLATLGGRKISLTATDACDKAINPWHKRAGRILRSVPAGVTSGVRALHHLRLVRRERKRVKEAMARTVELLYKKFGTASHERAEEKTFAGITNAFSSLTASRQAPRPSSGQDPDHPSYADASNDLPPGYAAYDAYRRPSLRRKPLGQGR
jgi:hypothetical protein